MNSWKKVILILISLCLQGNVHSAQENKAVSVMNPESIFEMFFNKNGSSRPCYVATDVKQDAQDINSYCAKLSSRRVVVKLKDREKYSKRSFLLSTSLPRSDALSILKTLIKEMNACIDLKFYVRKGRREFKLSCKNRPSQGNKTCKHCRGKYKVMRGSKIVLSGCTVKINKNCQ